MTSETDSARVQRVIARNTLWNVAGRAWEAISTLILTPYIVWRVGLSDYGVWGLVASFSGYVGLLDLGLGSGYAKFIAEYAARKDSNRISALVSTAMAFYAALGLVLAALGFPLLVMAASGFARLMNVPAEKAGDLVFLAQCAFALFLAGNCIAPFAALQAGLQRMDITNRVSFTMSLLKVIVTAAFLESGFGLRGLMYANAIVLAAFGVVSMAVAFRLEPGLRIAPRFVHRSAFQSLFGYGWRAQIARLSNLITFETDIVIVSLVFKTMGLAGAYKVGVELANKVRQVPLMLLGAILPAASDLDAREDHMRLQRLYLVGTKYVAALTIPLTLFCAAAAGPIMQTWMGPGLGDAAWVFRVIVIGYAANVLQGPGISVALGMGKPGVQMNTGLISMSTNIVLTIALAFTIGFIGVAVATSASMYLSMIWFLIWLRRLTDVRGAALWKCALRWPVWASVPGVLACTAIDMAMRGHDGRLINAAALCGASAVFGLSYLFIIRLTPFLDAFDAHFLEETLHLNRVPAFSRLLRRARSRGVAAVNP